MKILSKIFKKNKEEEYPIIITKQRICNACGGKGYRFPMLRAGIEEVIDCTHCGGTGKVRDKIVDKRKVSKGRAFVFPETRELMW